MALSGEFDPELSKLVWFDALKVPAEWFDPLAGVRWFLAAASGSFVESGQAVALTAARRLSTNVGRFALSGNIVPHPNDFGDWTLTGVTVQSNAGTTPPGSSGASDIIKSAIVTPSSFTSATLRGRYKASSGYGGAGGSWTDQSGHSNALTITGTSQASDARYHHVPGVSVSSGNRAVKTSFSYGTTNGKVTLYVIGRFTGTSGNSPVGRAVMYSDGAFNGEGIGVNTSKQAVETNDIGVDGTGTTALDASLHALLTTKQNGGNQILYVDGSQEASITAITNDPADAETFAIGCDGAITSAYVNGDIVEAGIFNGLIDATDRAAFDAYARMITFQGLGTSWGAEALSTVLGPAPAGTYTFTVKVKATGARWFAVELLNNLDNTRDEQVAWFDLTNGVVGSTFDPNGAWGFTDCTVNVNAGFTPASGPTSAATQIVETGAASVVPLVYQSQVLPYDLPVTVSFSAKAGTQSWAAIQFLYAYESGATTYALAYFNLSTGALGSTFNTGPAPNCTSTITSIGSGVYRCTITISQVPAGLNRVSIGAVTADLGGGYTGVAGHVAIEVDGVQFEVGTSASTYVATTDAASGANLFRYSERVGYAGVHSAPSSSIESLGSGWYKVHFTSTLAYDASDLAAKLYVCTADLSIFAPLDDTGTSEFEIAEAEMRSLVDPSVTFKVGMPAAQGAYVETGEAVVLTKQSKLALAQGSYVESGQAITPRVTMPAAQGSYAESGQAAGLTKQSKIVAAVGTFVETGEAVAFAVAMPASTGTYVESGQAAGLTKQSKVAVAQGAFTETGLAALFAVSMGASQGGYAETGFAIGLAVTMPAAQGAYVQTGQSITPRVTMPATAGSYVVTGEAVAFSHGYGLTAAQGAFVETGQSVSFVVTMPAAFGSYALSGQAVRLVKVSTLAVVAGSFAVAGQAASMAVAMPAVGGLYALAGQSILLTHQARLALVQGAYALSGQAVGLLTGHIITAAQGAYVLTGEDVSMRVLGAFTADNGSFALTGKAAELQAQRIVSAGPGTFALTGESVAMSVGRRVGVAPGSYALSGSPAGRLLTMPAGVGAFVWTGLPVDLHTAAVDLVATGGAYELAGYAATLVTARRLLAEVGPFALYGQAVELVLAGLWRLRDTTLPAHVLQTAPLATARDTTTLATVEADPMIIRQNDTEPPITANLLVGNETPSSPLVGTLTFRLEDTDGNVVFERPATVVDADAWKVRYDWQVGDTSTRGVFNGVWIVVNGASRRTFPTIGAQRIGVE